MNTKPHQHVWSTIFSVSSHDYRKPSAFTVLYGTWDGSFPGRQGGVTLLKARGRNRLIGCSRRQVHPHRWQDPSGVDTDENAVLVIRTIRAEVKRRVTRASDSGGLGGKLLPVLATITLLNHANLNTSLCKLNRSKATDEVKWVSLCKSKAKKH